MKKTKKQIEAIDKDIEQAMARMKRADGKYDWEVIGEYIHKYDDLEQTIFELADSVRGILTPIDSLLFLSSAVFFAKEGMLDRVGYVPDPSKPGCYFCDRINDQVRNIWSRVINDQNFNPDCGPYAELRGLRFSDEDAKRVFEQLVQRYYASDRAMAASCQPLELTSLMVGLLDYKGGSVYNPFAGVASFGVALGEGVEYFGEELESATFALGLMNLRLHGIDANNYVCGDSFDAHTKDTFDYIISTPPFGYRFRGRHPLSLVNLMSGKFDPAMFSGEMNDYILLSSAGRLNPGGKAVCLCSGSIAFSQRSEDARMGLIDSNLVDAIITLPSGLFANTSINTVAVVLNSGRKDGDPILMVDALKGYMTRRKLLANQLLEDISVRKAGVVKAVSEKEVKACNYSWLVGQYFQPDTVELPAGYEYRKIEELTERADHCIVPFPGRAFPEITAAALTTSPYTFRVQPVITDPSDPDFRMPSNRSRLMYTEPTFFISTMGRTKFGLANASNSAPVYAASGFIGLRLRSEIMPEYFAIKLSESNIDSFLVGAGIPHLRLSDVMNLQIPVPSLEEQAAVVKRMFAEHNVSLGREHELEMEISRLKKEFSDANGMNQHNLATPAAQIKATCQKMQRELKDGNIESANALLKRQLLQIQNLLATVYSLESGIGFGKKEAFNFDEYLSRYNEASYSDRFKLTYYLDSVALEEAELEPVINVNGSAFMQAVMNIIRNAEKHGFTDKGRDDYAMTIEVHLDPSGKYFLFEFSNNGSPLPDGMDAERYGTKGDSSGNGKGFGGYYVKKMAESFGGSIDVSSEPIARKEDRYLTTITIKLPVMEDEL